MAFSGRTADSMTSEVLTRVRDFNGQMHTPAFVWARLTDAQRFLNGILGISISSFPMTVNAGQNVYLVSTSIPSCIRVVGVRGSGGVRDAAQLPSIESFLIYGSRWMRRTGPYIESWATIGRDVLVLYPAINTQTTVDVYFAVLCAAFTTGSDISDFSFEQCGLIVNLTEALLLLRQRDLAAAGRAMARLQQAINPETATERLGLTGATQAAMVKDPNAQ